MNGSGQRGTTFLFLAAGSARLDVDVHDPRDGGGLGTVGLRVILTARRGPPTDVPEWRNWQTRGTQNPVPFTGSVGSIPSSGTSLRSATPSFGLVNQRVPVT